MQVYLEFVLVGMLWLGQDAPARCVVAESPQWARRPVPPGTIAIIPSFTPGMSEPEFRVQFINSSDEATDGLNVFLQEAVQLDGTEHPRLLVRWAGGAPVIPPKGEWSHTLSVSDFLPRAPSGTHTLPLSPGRHTLSLAVGPTVSAEVVFAWNPPQ
jgi:hypothetical protein